MTRRHHFAFPARRALLGAAVGAALYLPMIAARAATFPVTE